uniref:Protein odr-4 homolog n=1 Tax=Oryza meridionalis TaxID=40149 RepID=A0A0E0EWE4_9ORYZ
MVKTVVGEEAQLKALEETLSASASPAQMGLIVGKLSASSDRALAYSLIPTPPTDSGAPACSLLRAAPNPKAAKAASSDASSSLDFDVDWVAEHARQVSRMLLGGMTVIGIYIWASEASFKATSPAVLSQVLRAVSQVAPLWACRICDMSSGRLRPCDFKNSKLLASLQTFRCTYNFEIRLPVVQAEPFKKVISKAISHLTKQVQNAKALIDGVLFLDGMDNTLEGPHNVEFLVPFKNNLPAEVVQAEPFKKVISKAISHLTKQVQNAKALIDGVLFLDGMDNTLEGPHNVEFLVPFKNNLPAEEGVAGLLLFAGSVSALAYLGPKESIAEVISDLKLDIITSLRSRLDIILDEADDDSTTNNLENSLSQKATQVVFHELRVPYSFPFPRRILIPWLAGSYICDYLQQSETTEDAMERCKEVMSLEADMGNYSIVEPESASAATLGSFWDVVPGALSKAPSEPGLKEMNSGQNGSRKTHGSSFSILMAFVVLLIAVLVGCIFTLSATLMT